MMGMGEAGTKLTETVNGRVEPEIKNRLTVALKTLQRTESHAVRTAVELYLPELEAEAELISKHRKGRRSA